MAAFDQIGLLPLKKYLLCTLLILKINHMLDSENQKQSLIDAFEYRCSWKFRKFHKKILWATWVTLLQKTPTHVVWCEISVIFRNTFFTEHLRWLLVENLFRSARERRLRITVEIYVVIWQMLLLLVMNVSSCIWRTLMFGCLSYFYKGD